MDLHGLVLAEPDEQGFCRALGTRPGSTCDVNIVRLLPGTKIAHGSLYLPCNVVRQSSSNVVPPEVVAPSGLKLREYQRQAVQFIEDSPLGCIIGLDVGLGKGQKPSANILTPTGFRQLGVLCVGDAVIGRDGKATLIEGVFNRGQLPFYRVVFSDHTQLDVSGDHLWTVTTVNWNKRGQPPQTLTTEQLLANGLHYANGHRKYFIPMVEPVHFVKQLTPLPLDPWLLGVLLGDGGYRHSPPYLHNPETDIQHRVATLLWGELQFVERPDTNGVTWAITNGCVGGRPNAMWQKLQELQLAGLYSHEKFVPKCYLLASPEDRLQVLRGLLDTDGDVAPDGIATTANTSSLRLKDDIVFLVQSLGGTARWHSRIPKYTYRGERREGRRAYRINIRLPSGVCPVSSEKHLRRWKGTSKYEPVRGIESIEALGNDACICIKVASRDGLYVTSDFIVTHNTTVACEYLHRHPELRPFVVVGPLIASGAWLGENADPWKHYGLRVHALRSRVPSGPELTGIDGYFVNYQILAPWNESIYADDETEMFEAWNAALEDDLDNETDRERKRELKGVHVEVVALMKASRAELRSGDPTEVVKHAGWEPWIACAANPKVIIVDECHEVRNIRNTYAKTVHKMCGRASVKKRIFLSATPVVNKIADLYYQLDSVQPKLWGHYVPYSEKIITSYTTRYCSAEHNGYGWNVNGESNTAELRDRLANVLLRLSRFDARKELPPFTRQRVDVATTALDREAYRMYRVVADETSAAARMLTGMSLQGDELKRLTGMFGLLSWAKRNVAVEHVCNNVRSVENRKLIIYTWFKDTAKYIAQTLRKRQLHVYGPVTGEMSIEKRNSDAEAFRDLVLEPNGAAVFVATIGSASQSLNPLAAASTALFVDLWYVPQVLLQAEGRIHREGQLAANVLAQYLYVANTIDQIMWEHLEKKAKQIASATSDKSALSLCESLGGRNEDESLKALVKAMAGLSLGDLELT